MATATITIVLYNPSEKKIIAEVYEGEQYWRPTTVTRYNGTLKEFLIEYPDYTFESAANGNNIPEVFDDVAGITEAERTAYNNV